MDDSKSELDATNSERHEKCTSVPSCPLPEAIWNSSSGILRSTRAKRVISKRPRRHYMALDSVLLSYTSVKLSPR